MEIILIPCFVLRSIKSWFQNLDRNTGQRYCSEYLKSEERTIPEVPRREGGEKRKKERLGPEGMAQSRVHGKEAKVELSTCIASCTGLPNLALP